MARRIVPRGFDIFGDFLGIDCFDPPVRHAAHWEEAFSFRHLGFGVEVEQPERQEILAAGADLEVVTIHLRNGEHIRQVNVVDEISLPPLESS